ATWANLSPVYRFLAAQPRGEPVVEVPMGKANFGDQDKYVVYTYNSLYHRQPLVNGYSTFLPPEYYALVKIMEKFPTKHSVKKLAEWGAQWIVVHADQFENRRELRAKLGQLKGIALVQEFGTEWLYRIE